MDDVSLMNGSEAGEKGFEVGAHLMHLHVFEVVSKVLVLEVGQDGQDLVMVANGGDERTDGVGAAEVGE